MKLIVIKYVKKTCLVDLVGLKHKESFIIEMMIISSNLEDTGYMEEAWLVYRLLVDGREILEIQERLKRIHMI